MGMTLSSSNCEETRRLADGSSSISPLGSIVEEEAVRGGDDCRDEIKGRLVMGKI